MSQQILPTASLRIFVVIASYGSKNDRLLAQIIKQYHAMNFAVDIVVLSNLNKTLPHGVEIRVGLPARNPWSLPFGHKSLFASRLSDYDLFIYSEDDILISEENILAFLEATPTLHEDEIAGFIRTEHGADGNVNYPDIHGQFRWDAGSAVKRGGYIFAFLSNEHAACYILTRDQLRKAIDSGGFLVKPHEWEYDLLCTAATDPYTQCGLKKLIPISHIDEFSVEHLSNRYVDTLGIGYAELRPQLDTLLSFATDCGTPQVQFNTETRLRKRMYSKDLYETPKSEIMSAIGTGTGSVLSIGCGSGAFEESLALLGWRVRAIPVDPVVVSIANPQRVEVLSHIPLQARRVLQGERFDWIIAVNILHLTSNPVKTISLFADLLSPEGRIAITCPNMLRYGDILPNLQSFIYFRGWWTYKKVGSRFTFAWKARRWCQLAGLNVDRLLCHFTPKTMRAGPLVRRLLSTFLATEFTIIAKSGNVRW